MDSDGSEVFYGAIEFFDKHYIRHTSVFKVAIDDLYSIVFEWLSVVVWLT
jgi:hypothetical protein